MLIMTLQLCGSASAASAAPVRSAIVNPHQTYSYEVMTRDLHKLAEAHPGLIRLHTIGQSEYGRELWAADLGTGEAIVLLNGSHHAREWMTTILLMTMLDRYAIASEKDAAWNGIPVRDLLARVTFRFVPMVNPDGVTLQQEGLAAFPEEDHAALIAMNDGSSSFKRWKANAKGIDLNRQYPADWANIRDPRPGPHYMNYKGKAPLTAKEAQAMAEATIDAQPEIALAYHSSGEIVYWHFHNNPDVVKRDRNIVNLYSELTGYRIVEPTKNPSGGGYKDWFIQQFGRPALTPELGRRAGETNVPLTEWARIWNQHRDTGWMLAEQAYTLWLKRQSVEEVRSEIRLTKTVRAQKWPDPKSSLLDVVYPGRYKLLLKKGDWAQIQTAEGTRWVPAHDAPIGTFEPLYGMTITLAKDTPLFDSPLAFRAVERIEEETEFPLHERWEDWLMILTPQGGRWMKVEALGAEAGMDDSLSAPADQLTDG